MRRPSRSGRTYSNGRCRTACLAETRSRRRRGFCGLTAVLYSRLHPLTHKEGSMYGTVARMHVKPGMGAQLEELDRQEAEMANIAGYVGEVVYQMDAEPDVYYLAIIFESKAAYDA